MFLIIFLILVAVLAFYYKENLRNISYAEYLKSTTDNYSIPVVPTPEDPFMNNENDILKVLPPFDNDVFDKMFTYQSGGAFQDAAEVYSLKNDRTFITYPAEDQQAFIDFLGFGTMVDRGLRFEDLRTKRRE